MLSSLSCHAGNSVDRRGSESCSSRNCNNDYDRDDAALSRTASKFLINGHVDAVSHKEQAGLRPRGLRQSPIDINCDGAEIDRSLRSLALCYCRDDKARLINDGKTPACYVTPSRHFLAGGPLRESYELLQYHIHFAGGGAHGSEHTLNGRGYPAEIHFVHYKVAYGDFTSALEHPDGLAVVGAFIDVDNNNGGVDEQLDSDIRKMANVVTPGAVYQTVVDLAKYEIATAATAAKSKDFYCYSGSLTSAPYDECVEWILLKEPVTVSAEAFRVLKELRTASGETMLEHGNSRSTQDGNGRLVRCNFSMNRRLLMNPVSLF